MLIIGGASTAFAIFQPLGLTFWPTYPGSAPGLFYNPIAQGEFLALVILLVSADRYWDRLWFITAFLGIGVVLSHSRGAILSVAVGLLAQFTRSPLYVTLAVVAFGLWFTAFPSVDDLTRLAIWSAAASHLTLWGNGLGSFWDLWMGVPAIHPMYVHNDYLQLLFELGVFALPIFTVVGFAVTRTSATLWPTLVAFLFMASFSMPLHIPLVALIGAVALASCLFEGTQRCVSSYSLS